MVLCSELWVQESGKHQGERKIDLLIHALVSTITLTTFPLDFLILFFVKFLFSFLFSLFSFLCVFSLSIYLLSLFLSPPVHNYLYPFYTCLNLWDFSLLSPRLYQQLLVSYGHPPGLPTNLLVAWSLYLLRGCLLHHSLFLDKSSCFVSLSLTTLSPLSG